MAQSPFISYAQNNEDVLLWRALKDVRNGFYIDVGAQSPTEYSVTKAFYDRGWHGINVEPVPHWYEQLAQERPHDINLQIAVSNQTGKLKLFEVEDTGLSTSNPEFAHRHDVAGYTLQERVVECTTLDQVCTDNEVQTVHFLKIDCEGAEKLVLEGVSLSSVRPWIILVEATEPLGSKPTWRQWEHLLTGRDYHFAFFDGLNRYYLADEHMELAAAFDAPVNVFDNVQRISEIDTQKHIDGLQREIEALKGATAVAQLQTELAAVTSERDAVAAERDAVTFDRDAVAAKREALKVDHDAVAAERDAVIAERDTVMTDRDAITAERDAIMAERDDLKVIRASMLASHSWRITAPLRGFSRASRWISHHLCRTFYLAVRPFARMARPVLRWLARSSRIRWVVVRVFGKHSRITKTFRLFLFGDRYIVITSDGQMDVDKVMNYVRMEIDRSNSRR